MSIFHRLPADVRKALPTERGERVLTFAAGADSGYVVATNLALYLTDGTRLPYEEIDRASWDEDGVKVLTTDGLWHAAKVTEPRLVPETVRERVNSTIVVNKHVKLPGRGGVRLVARRRPGGEVLGWTLVFDDGLDPEDPGLRAQAEQALEGLRRSMGV
ncbi:hypothetical protein FH608_010280 [Nonomuraea phyllanthi]|uniref:Uncharacterized protein n=1 Tax=Nonomuraea phyllanthi TaxID=2219224 RepID=A0A5C4WQC6_9ACTN|nr:hypothetical protein [Nonomuraea phyllanthi]KAB8195873.1 hypothetical protein FH608_010280 [Nonomuraea phyllanthi]QFY07328.1 hypothetical protein GBF35_12075 [Nonomuraea phyllanthi]